MRIVIEVVAGQLKVAGDGVLQDKIATLGLIELAKAAILSQTVPAQHGIAVPDEALKNRLLASPPGANGTHGG